MNWWLGISSNMWWVSGSDTKCHEPSSQITQRRGIGEGRWGSGGRRKQSVTKDWKSRDTEGIREETNGGQGNRGSSSILFSSFLVRLAGLCSVRGRSRIVLGQRPARPPTLAHVAAHSMVLHGRSMTFSPP
jgi:hypothetical protein